MARDHHSSMKKCWILCWGSSDFLCLFYNRSCRYSWKKWR